jgi:hypothetical protein
MHGKWEYAGFWYLHEPDIKPASARVWLRMANNSGSNRVKANECRVKATQWRFLGQDRDLERMAVESQ